MFNLYCDNRRQVDLSDILSTARTLGFDKKFKLIYQAVEGINADLAGEWVDYETMLKLITEKVGNPFNESGRKAMFALVDEENKEVLTFVDLKKISEQLKFNLNDE
jgi:Ca2+-binding EF-hand superfamily protein